MCLPARRSLSFVQRGLLNFYCVVNVGKLIYDPRFVCSSGEEGLFSQQTIPPPFALSGCSSPYLDKLHNRAWERKTNRKTLGKHGGGVRKKKEKEKQGALEHNLTVLIISCNFISILSMLSMSNQSFQVLGPGINFLKVRQPPPDALSHPRP
jgi:hypothetical protein